MKNTVMLLSGILIVLIASFFILGCGGGGGSAVTAPGIGVNITTARVASVTPSDGADSVPTNTAVTVEFTGQMHMQSVHDNFHVYQGITTNGAEVMGTFSWNVMQTMMTFTPDSPMTGGATHTIHFGTGMMGQNGGMMMNMSGQAMSQDMYMYFTTE